MGQGHPESRLALKLRAMLMPFGDLRSKGRAAGPPCLAPAALRGPPAAAQPHSRGNMQGLNCKQDPEAASDWTESFVLSPSFI